MTWVDDSFSATRVEKDRNALKSELDDLQSQLDHVMKGKSQAEKMGKSLEHQLGDLSRKLDDSNRATNDINAQRARDQVRTPHLEQFLLRSAQQRPRGCVARHRHCRLPKRRR